MRSSGRGRTGKPFLVAPNGHAAWRHNNEQPDRKTSCSAVSGRHGRGGRGRGGGTSYNGQGDEEEAVPPTSITINLLTLAVLVFYHVQAGHSTADVLVVGAAADADLDNQSELI